MSGIENRYKLILANARLYKEIELPEEKTAFRLGTTKACSVRLNRERFFCDFELALEWAEDGWSISCGEHIYLTADGVMKLYTKDLAHGDELHAKYAQSNQELLKLSFLYDFDIIKPDFSRCIDLGTCESLTLGGARDCPIRITDPLLGSGIISLTREGNRLRLTDHSTRYGIYLNGCRVRGSAQVKPLDFFSVVGVTFCWKENALYTTAGDSVEVSGLDERMISEGESQLEYPKFNRNTRVQYVPPEGEIELQQPPPKPQKPRKNIILTLIPSLSMLALVILLRGAMGGGGMFVLYSAATMSIGVIMSVVTYLYDDIQIKQDTAAREEQYLTYLMGKEEEIRAAQENEIRILNLVYTDLTEAVGQVERFDRRLFERSREDADFLDVRLGTGTVESHCAVGFQKQDFVDSQDPISQMPEQLSAQYRRIDGAPILSHLGASNAVGVVGLRSGLYEMLKNMTLDLAIRHFYQDVRLFYLLPDGEEERFAWLRWLPHTRMEGTGLRGLMYHEESRNVLLELLYSELSKREAVKREKDDAELGPDFVVLVFDSAGIRKHPISKYVQKCKEYGFTFLFFEEYEELLPQGCTEMVRLAEDETRGARLLSENGDVVAQFFYDAIPDETAEWVALRLAPVYIDEVNLDSALTKSISIFDLLNIFGLTDLDLGERWEKSEVYKSMAAPLGVKLKNEVVCLDISDKSNAHGPHGLVAGTTGSGKSEILQSYVLSMATLFHPYDVGFVVIDFKGGGMVNQFRELPHLIGAITNIDGREIDRSLSAIRAELLKRQSFFAQSGVNHINDYIKLYKRHEVSQPLPHLIIIVDEFAELKTEYPDFMKEIVSAARIGRTLGVHLILATQKPSGVVDNQIWSNSKFKLCLKVQTKEDSNEVIKSPLAAEIVEPGRAYFQVGNNEIFELFQSAYSGADVPEENGEKTTQCDIYTLELWGKRTLAYTNRVKRAKDGAQNQLQALVGYIRDYCKEKGIHPLAGICMPPLETVVVAADLPPPPGKASPGVAIPVGLYDDPEQQRQDSLMLEFSEGNVFIVASAQMGKTTFLQTILYQAIAGCTPAQINFYVIDCGSRSLKVFEQSRHVGGVVLPTEEERIFNLFKLLYNIISQRKDRFGAVGVGTFRAYLEAGFDDLPQIVLVVDNIAAFREYYGDLDDELLYFSREGQGVGLNLVFTASQINAINYKTAANFGIRFAFHCNDSGEYSSLFDRCRIEPRETPGRGLCLLDRRLVEFQAALCVEGEKEIDRVENLRTALEGFNTRHPTQKAPPIPEVPEVILHTQLLAEQKELYTQPYRVPVGIDYATVSYRFLDLLSVGAFVLTGREKSGKTNFVKHLFRAIQANIFKCMTQAYVLDSADMALEPLRNYGFVERYTVDAADTALLVETLHALLSARQERVQAAGSAGRESALDGEPLLLLVVDEPRFFDELAKEKELQSKFLDLLKRLKPFKVLLLFSNLENAQVSFQAPEALKQLKEQKKVFFFDELSNGRFLDFSVQQQREYKKPLKLGDCYQCFSGEISKLKTILDE